MLECACECSWRMFTVKGNMNINESNDAFICAYCCQGHSSDVILDVISQHYYEHTNAENLRNGSQFIQKKEFLPLPFVSNQRQACDVQ